MEETVLPSFQEIEDHTKTILSETSFSIDLINNQGNPRIMSLRKRLDRKLPDGSFDNIVYVLELLSLGAISEEEVINEFKKLHDFDIGQRLRQTIIHQNKVGNINIRDCKKVYNFLKELKEKYSGTYKDLRNLSLDLGIRQVFQPETFKEKFLEFWKNQETNLTSYDWWFLRPVIVSAALENSNQEILDLVLENRAKHLIETNSDEFLKFSDFKKLFRLSNLYVPGNIFDHFPDLRSKFEENHTVKKENIKFYNSVLEELLNKNIYKFPIKKIEINPSKITTKSQLPYDGYMKENDVFEVLSIHNLGFNLYTSDNIQQTPVDYEYYFEGFRNIYDLLLLECAFVGESGLTYNNEFEPIEESHKMKILFDNKSYSITFTNSSLGWIEAEYFIALNNGFLKSINSDYRFLKLNDNTDIILVSKENIDDIESLFKKYDY